MQVLSSGELTQQALCNQANMWLDRDWWLSSTSTEDAASAIFRVTSHSAGTIFFGVHIRFAQYPYRLAELLHHDVDSDERQCAVAEFLAAAECMLDEFSARLRRQFPTAASMNSLAFQNLLTASLSTLSGTTFSTERLHAKNTRQIASRVMTSKLSVHQAAIFHAGSATPEVAVDIQQASAGQGNKRKTGTQTQEQAPKKRRGGGGAWRAFTHQMHRTGEFRGGKGSWKGKRLSDMYRALSAEQKQALQTLGQLATASHRAGGKAFASTYSRSAQQGERISTPSLSASADTRLPAGMSPRPTVPETKDIQ